MPTVGFPLVMGHEAAGEVVAVGTGVDAVGVGDRVVITSTAPCGRCEQCRRNRTYQCSNRQRGPAGPRLHLDGAVAHPFADTGCMAERVVVNAGQLVPLPDDVPLDVMALVGCGVMTGLGAVFNAAPPAPGESALVVGCGGVGLNVVQGLRLAGANPIIAVDPNPARRDLARQFGATHTVDPNMETIEEGVRRIIPQGTDLSFEVVGSTDLLAQALLATRPGGTCTMVGVPDAPTISIPAQALLPGERRLQGCNMGSGAPHRDIPKIVDLYRAGRIMLDELVGERLPVTSFLRAFADAESGAIARCLLTFS
jgi:S-(hydroxymethyl)glutathione dehydrogenase/alcohol dehydrogenase